MTSAVIRILRTLFVAMSFSQFQFRISIRLKPSSRLMLNNLVNFKGSRRWQTRETASATFLEKVILYLKFQYEGVIL
jgi:hypothetical protein